MNTQTQAALKMAIDFLDGSYEAHKVRKALQEALEQPQCNPHPNAPHGFCRDASHNSDRYVCECEFWEQPAQEPVALKFPTTLRKMWSGGEVQEWLDQQQPLYTTLHQHGKD
jgi:hypothetical protein